MAPYFLNVLLITASLLAWNIMPVSAGEVSDREPYPIEVEFREAIKRDIGGNAAVQYLAACLELPVQQDDRLNYFITSTLQRCPPEVFKQFPEAATEVARYSNAVRFLHQGAVTKACSFGVDWSAGLDVHTSHITRLRNLARRAAAYGKYLEWEGRQDSAASVYLDIVQLGCHLDENADYSQLMVGASIVGTGITHLQSLLSREADEKTARLILDGLKDVPKRPFSISHATNVERLLCGTSYLWAMQDTLATTNPEQFITAMNDAVKVQAVLQRRLGETFGRGPGIEELPFKKVELSADKLKLKETIEGYVHSYNETMKTVVATAEGPYYKTRVAVDRLQKEMEELGRSGNVIAMSSPAIVPILINTTKAETGLGATEILAAALVAKAKSGKYPILLSELKGSFPAGLPQDPFTGKDFSYRLDNALPAVESLGNGSDTRKMQPSLFIFSLAEIRKRETERMKHWPADWEEHQKLLHEVEPDRKGAGKRRQIDDVF